MRPKLECSSDQYLGKEPPVDLHGVVRREIGGDQQELGVIRQLHVRSGRAACEEISRSVDFFALQFQALLAASTDPRGQRP